MNIKPLGEDIWQFARPHVVGALHMGTATTVIRSAQGEIALHSVGPDVDVLANDLREIGKVTTLIVPNLLHTKFLPSAMKQFPGAAVYAQTGVKVPGTFHSLESLRGSVWSSEVEMLIAEGMPKLREWVFFHKKSKTLILTDLAFNIVSSPSMFTRIFMRLNGAYGRFGPSKIFRTMVKDRGALRQSITRITAWDFDQVSVCHGSLLDDEAKPTFVQAYAWL